MRGHLPDEKLELELRKWPIGKTFWGFAEWRYSVSLWECKAVGIAGLRRA